MTASLVAVAAVVASNALAEQEALRDATERAEGIALGVAAPFVDAGVRTGEERSLAHLNEVFRARISEGGITDIVIWAPEGRVLWSNDVTHIGEVHELSEEARSALTSLSTVANLPEDNSAHADEFYYETGQLEVYVGVLGVDGEPFLFEAYLPASRIAADRSAVLPKLLLVSLGSLFVLLAVTVPLALSLARRVDEAQRQRDLTLSRSVDSWSHQQRLLAHDLHDGVIQDLAALGYGLAVLEQRETSDATARVVLTTLRESAEHAERAVRSMIVDLTPQQLADQGLTQAVTELVQRHRREGLNINLTMGDDLVCPEGSGALAYRTLREGLRNIDKHTNARHVRIDIRATDEIGGVEVEIVDDGTAPAHEHDLLAGHGLGLLLATLRDVGGDLDIGPAPGGGTRLYARIPSLRTEPGRPAS